MESLLFEKILVWCRDNDNVRTAILTSSRTRQDGSCDSLSDYDLELYVKELEEFRQDDDWLEEAGDVLIRWPLKPETTWSDHWITRLIQYKEGTRIDFQITSLTPSYHESFNVGYRVIIDKDRLCDSLPLPDFSQIKLKKPSIYEFNDRLNSFFWDILYVAKALRRDEPYYARYMIHLIHNECLQPLIEWHIGFTKGWNLSINREGRLFKKYLSKEDWQRVSSSMLCRREEDLWDMMNRMIDLASYLGVSVAKELNCSYPVEKERGIRDYAEQIKRQDL
jgi:aminoglycoside 6-adenylyltransferase